MEEVLHEPTRQELRTALQDISRKENNAGWKRLRTSLHEQYPHWKVHDNQVRKYHRKDSEDRKEKHIDHNNQSEEDADLMSDSKSSDSYWSCTSCSSDDNNSSPREVPVSLEAQVQDVKAAVAEANRSGIDSNSKQDKDDLSKNLSIHINVSNQSSPVTNLAALEDTPEINSSAAQTISLKSAVAQPKIDKSEDNNASEEVANSNQQENTFNYTTDIFGEEKHYDTTTSSSSSNEAAKEVAVETEVFIHNETSILVPTSSHEANVDTRIYAPTTSPQRNVNEAVQDEEYCVLQLQSNTEIEVKDEVEGTKTPFIATDETILLQPSEDSVSMSHSDTKTLIDYITKKVETLENERIETDHNDSVGNQSTNLDSKTNVHAVAIEEMSTSDNNIECNNEQENILQDISNIVTESNITVASHDTMQQGAAPEMEAQGTALNPSTDNLNGSEFVNNSAMAEHDVQYTKTTVIPSEELTEVSSMVIKEQQFVSTYPQEILSAILSSAVQNATVVVGEGEQSVKVTNEELQEIIETAVTGATIDDTDNAEVVRSIIGVENETVNGVGDGGAETTTVDGNGGGEISDDSSTLCDTSADLLHTDVEDSKEFSNETSPQEVLESGSGTMEYSEGSQMTARDVFEKTSFIIDLTVKSTTVANLDLCKLLHMKDDDCTKLVDSSVEAAVGSSNNVENRDSKNDELKVETMNVLDRNDNTLDSVNESVANTDTVGSKSEDMNSANFDNANALNVDTNTENDDVNACNSQNVENIIKDHDKDSEEVRGTGAVDNTTASVDMETVDNIVKSTASLDDNLQEVDNMIKTTAAVDGNIKNADEGVPYAKGTNDADDKVQDVGLVVNTQNKEASSDADARVQDTPRVTGDAQKPKTLDNNAIPVSSDTVDNIIQTKAILDGTYQDVEEAVHYVNITNDADAKVQDTGLLSADKEAVDSIRNVTTTNVIDGTNESAASTVNNTEPITEETKTEPTIPNDTNNANTAAGSCANDKDIAGGKSAKDKDIVVRPTIATIASTEGMEEIDVEMDPKSKPMESVCTKVHTAKTRYETPELNHTMEKHATCNCIIL